jgi:hypothetical protein
VRDDAEYAERLSGCCEEKWGGWDFRVHADHFPPDAAHDVAVCLHVCTLTPALMTQHAPTSFRFEPFHKG